MKRTLVAGIDSSTQSCKVMVHDANTGELIRSGSAFHRTGTAVNPSIWLDAFNEAVVQAGGLKDVSAISIAGQQHGLVTLDSEGKSVRDAILWNDTRSAEDAENLISELGEGNSRKGKQRWVDITGSVPVASLTVTKLCWLAREESRNLQKTAAAVLPHDWLSWKISASEDIKDIFTDRSEASGTGYYDAQNMCYVNKVLELAIGQRAQDILLPKVVGHNRVATQTLVKGKEMLMGAGCGDNAGAALGLDLKPGQVALSVGTSGVVSLICETPIKDYKGQVAGFADATGKYLPLIVTLNASRVMDAVARLLDVNFAKFSELALTAPPGAEGLVMIPYMEGERTPNLPNSTGSLHGLRLSNLTPANFARAAVEGMLCSVGFGIDILRQHGIDVTSLVLIGGGARSEAVRRIAPSVLGLPVTVPEPGEYVAEGAARQAAWVLNNEGGDTPPAWKPRLYSSYDGKHDRFIMDRFNSVKDLHVQRNQLDFVQL